jgi:hypothetical protein
MDAASLLPHEPEAVAPDPVHVRVDHGNRRRHGHHGLDRIAARSENGLAGLGGKPVGSRDGGCREDGSFGHGPLNVRHDRMGFGENLHRRGRLG